MNPAGWAAVLTAAAALVTAIGTLISHLQTRRQLRQHAAADRVLAHPPAPLRSPPPPGA